MPIRLRYLLDRLPLPSLQYYTFISTSLLLGNVLYFHHMIQTNNLNPNESSFIPPIVENLTDVNNLTNQTTNISISNQSIFFSDAKPISLAYTRTLLSILVSQSFSLLILVNAVYCSLVFFAKSLQVFIFGELRLVELQRIKDKFWNYAFYKFCFLFGVLGLENLNELVLWISWFSVLAFAILFCQLAKDRFELLSVSAAVRRRPLVKVVSLLISLLVLCLGLFIICFQIGLKYGGLSIFFFMLAETALLTLDTSYLIFKYTLQYYTFEQQQNRLTSNLSHERRSIVIYYLEFIFDVVTLTIDIIHHLQMLFYHQTFMSMSSLIFFMQLKPLFNELTQRLKRHKSYQIAMARMEKKYPLLTKHDLEQKYMKNNHISSLEEICSICWEKFEKARCLPCGHLFHQNCLRSWLEQDTTCPICRLSLHEDNPSPTTGAPARTTTAAAAPVETPNIFLWPSLTIARLASNVNNLATGTGQRAPRNHLFRFDGSRYSSWLPSFSIEINHNFPFRLGRTRLTGVQLTSMAQSVQQIFPQIPYEIILSDLQRTQSIDATIENIIDRRIRLEQTQQQAHHQQETSASEESSYTSSSGSSSEADEPVDGELLSNSSRTAYHDDNNDPDTFSWPLDSRLPLAIRKQQLISHMRRQFLERERGIPSVTPTQKSDLLSAN